MPPAGSLVTSVGVDLIEIERVRRALARYPRFRERCFTDAERAYCDSRPNPAQSYAGRFAVNGWSAATVDGHDHDALEAALRAERTTAPNVVVAVVGPKNSPTAELNKPNN